MVDFLYISILVQIIFESLPLSSSGHVALVLTIAHYLGDMSPTFLTPVIDYILHVPTLIIVAMFFRRRWLFLMQHPLRCWRIIWRLIMLGICAEIPTLIIYTVFSTYSIHIPLWLGFLITAQILFSLRAAPAGYRQRITMSAAFLVGVAQGCALLPGISRLAATYAMGRWLGLSARSSLTFSWTIAFPLMAAAALKGCLAIQPSELLLMEHSITLAIMACASAISYLAFGWVASQAVNGGLWRLCFYMYIPAFLAIIL